MVVRIRLARFGKRHAPHYNIVVAQARSGRNDKPLEVIGMYDPIPKPSPRLERERPTKDIQLDIARAKYWLGVGAQPSEPAWRLLAMLGLLEPKYTADRTEVIGGNKFADRFAKKVNDSTEASIRESADIRVDSELKGSTQESADTQGKMETKAKEEN